MSQEQEKKSITEKVLGTIVAGRVKMRPRWYFMLNAFLLIAGSSMVFLTVLYVVSFTLFVIRQSGVWFAPSFGLRGFGAFITALPWILILVAFVFIFILETLVRRYAFAYRRPLLYSALGIVGITLVGGVLVARTQFHQALYMRAGAHQLPVAGALYRGCCGAPRGDIHRGTINDITDAGFSIVTLGGETIMVTVTPRTRFPYGADFAEGDPVVIFGDRDDDTVSAFGIRKIDDWFEPAFRGPGFHRHFRMPQFEE